MKKIKEFVVKHLQFLVKRMPFDHNKFWNERYKKYNKSVLYCGNIGSTEAENIEKYKQLTKQIVGLTSELGLDKNCKILDIGCGTGMYAERFYKEGFKNYTGIDLNKKIISELNKKGYESYKFIQKDIIKEKLEGEYSLILMLAVAGHIVNDKHLYRILYNIKKMLRGYFLVTDCDEDKRTSVYTRRRTIKYYERVFGKPVKIIDKFRQKKLMVFESEVK